MRDTGGQLTERGELLRLDQAVLRGPQILQRFRQFAGTSFHVFEQARVLDRHHRLVGKGLQQIDGGLWELARRLAPDHQRADDVVWAQQGNNQDAAIALAQDDLVERGGLVANVGDLDWLALRCRRPNIRVAEADMPVGDRRDHGLAHAVGGMQAKLLALLVEHIDRAGVGARQLHCLGRQWW